MCQSLLWKYGRSFSSVCDAAQNVRRQVYQWCVRVCVCVCLCVRAFDAFCACAPVVSLCVLCGSYSCHFGNLSARAVQCAKCFVVLCAYFCSIRREGCCWCVLVTACNIYFIGSTPKEYYGKIGRRLSSSSSLHFPSSFTHYPILFSFLSL